MSEEVARSIGDVLAENERLKQQLAQAERNAEEWKSIALTTRLTAEAWEQAAVRLERKTEKTAAVNRELNIQALVWMERATVLERTARRLVVAWRAERKALRAVNEAWLRDGKAIEGLRAALQGLLDEPYGCALCDAGRLLSPAKVHMDECPYEIARALLNELEAGMYSGDEYYGDDVTSPLERPLFSGYKGGPLMNPLARIQKDTNMTPQEALDYINGARFANYSGQIVERRDGRDRYIVCEIGCNCSEIPGKISDEYGEALVTLLNSVEVLLAQQGTFTRMIAEVCDHNETLHNALRLIAKNEPSTLDVRGIARDALNAIKPIDADE